MKCHAPVDGVDGTERETISAQLGLISFVLAENRNDLLSLGMFVFYVSQHPRSKGRPLKDAALRYLENALAADLLTVGDMVEGRYRPWPVSYTQALERVRAAWPVHDEPTFDELRDICWLANTTRGNQAAALRGCRRRSRIPQPSGI
ncbi:hypothetical protein [Arthrobacter bambusae]|uniref:Uncharacterized protein n=1 Tax=Arthrobacter bambusae TaxID=1338426 RepID=A0AAW8DHE4_9MICC|nr:hypothetical protein [Arthrobacter bambusae]MDP9904674.1 hypothetical protein [Arthrobacter bambusae]MDQ0129490.1 hypothetical protein [Arthrobacter bambusae]MDQ0180897.1 hypothetical protein [Arthrobacter bambusae]